MQKDSGFARGIREFQKLVGCPSSENEKKNGQNFLRRPLSLQVVKSLMNFWWVQAICPEAYSEDCPVFKQILKQNLNGRRLKVKPENCKKVIKPSPPHGFPIWYDRM